MARKAYQMTDNDCFSACVASILEVPVQDVPNIHSDGQEKLISFINAHGYTIMSFYFSSFTYGEWDEIVAFVSPCFFIATGGTERGDYHAVVYKDGKMWHDPHLSGEGIKEIDTISVFVAIDPVSRKDYKPCNCSTTKNSK